LGSDEYDAATSCSRSVKGFKGKAVGAWPAEEKRPAARSGGEWEHRSSAMSKRQGPPKHQNRYAWKPNLGQKINETVSCPPPLALPPSP